MIDEQKLQQTLRDFANDRDWEQFHSPRNLISALNVEAGELLELFQWESKNHVAHITEIPDTSCTGFFEKGKKNAITP